jgi:hypothetical protein
MYKGSKTFIDAGLKMSCLHSLKPLGAITLQKQSTKKCTARATSSSPSKRVSEPRRTSGSSHLLTTPALICSKQGRYPDWTTRYKNDEFRRADKAAQMMLEIQDPIDLFLTGVGPNSQDCKRGL